MAYDKDLADRLRGVLGERDHTERRMFGGLAFLLDGDMAVAASGRGGLMVRIDPGERAELLTRPEAGPMVMRGRELTGWVLVDADGLDDDALGDWIEIGVARARSLPA